MKDGAIKSIVLLCSHNHKPAANNDAARPQRRIKASRSISCQYEAATKRVQVGEDDDGNNNFDWEADNVKGEHSHQAFEDDLLILVGVHSTQKLTRKYSCWAMPVSNLVLFLFSSGKIT